MARAGANSLGTITNLEKWRFVNGAQFMVKRYSHTENGRKKFLHKLPRPLVGTHIFGENSAYTQEIYRGLGR